MSLNKVVNKNKDLYDIYIGRGSKWGNPFTHKDVDKTKAQVQVSSRKESIEMYEKWILRIIEIEGLNPPSIEEIRSELKDKVLGCFCKPKSCHGDVLSQIANGDNQDIEKMKQKYLKTEKKTIF